MSNFIKNSFFIYIALINIFGFIIMLIDKNRARNHEWRIKENTLILVALFGGSIGSYIGMKTFRHKTKHPKFKYGIPFIFLLQFIIYIYYIISL